MIWVADSLVFLLVKSSHFFSWFNHKYDMDLNKHVRRLIVVILFYNRVHFDITSNGLRQH